MTNITLSRDEIITLIKAAGRDIATSFICEGEGADHVIAAARRAIELAQSLPSDQPFTTRPALTLAEPA